MAAPDLIRILACFMVISIHFLLKSGFYDLPLDNPVMILMLALRILFSSCVPLFMILSGYLMVNKPLSKTHYAKGMKIVWIYLLASLACMVYSLYISNRSGFTLSSPTPEAVNSMWWGILSYRTAPYAWYVEMYFGLYLLIPFLNILYNHIPSKGWKRVLILSLFVMCSLPSILNANDFLTEGWLIHPSLSTSFQKLIPSWWGGMYPLVYYFIGAYLREYGVSLSKLWLSILTVASIGIAVLYHVWRADGGQFPWGTWNDWCSPFALITATLIFSLLISVDYSRAPDSLLLPLRYVSGLTLGMYLVSYIFDTEAYRILTREVPVIQDRFIFYLLVVPLIFLCSLILSALLDLIYRLFRLLYRRVRDLFIPSARREPARDDTVKNPRHIAPADEAETPSAAEDKG
jgi:surface polysaccharide O-acyltransferase-like enzyme